jgi:hypothetical protein
MNGPLSIQSAPPVADRPPSSGAANTNAAPGRGTARRASTLPAAGEGAAHTAIPEHQEVARLKGLLTDPDMRVSTHHDAASGRVVLQVQRGATGEVVEQLPSESLVRLYATMRKSLVDEQA